MRDNIAFCAPLPPPSPTLTSNREQVVPLAISVRKIFFVLRWQARREREVDKPASHILTSQPNSQICQLERLVSSEARVILFALVILTFLAL